MQADVVMQRIFTAPDAARIVGVPIASARRWLAGYSSGPEGAKRSYPARIGPAAALIDGVLLMSFLDVVEVQMAANLRRQRVSWPRIQEASAMFRKTWKNDHPFALQRFRTDGRAVLAEIGHSTGDLALLDVANNQYVFDQLIEQSLIDVLDFREDGTPWRLWANGRGSQVVVDPARSFGRPIIEASGIPVRALVSAYAANDNDIGRVARWFDVPAAMVEAALRYDAAARMAA